MRQKSQIRAKAPRCLDNGLIQQAHAFRPGVFAHARDQSPIQALGP
jgi:hypothetical protein